MGENYIWEKFGQAINYLDKDRDDYQAGIDYALKALQELHDAGIYHNDIINGRSSNVAGLYINTGNILINDGEYKLIDFGPDEVDAFEMEFNRLTK